MIPASAACSAKTWAASTAPDWMGAVTSSTSRPSGWPASARSFFAFAMSRVRCGSVGVPGSNGEYMSLPTEPWPEKTCSTICPRSTTSRNASRTRASSNGAVSTRMVNGSQLPVSESTVCNRGSVLTTSTRASGS